MLDDTRPDSEFEAEQEIESLPDVGPLPPDDFSGINDWDPRITERQPVEDYGIPGIDLDNSGQIKVPKLKPRGPKADYCLLEEARGEFFMGMNMDVPTPIAWLWPQRIAIGKLTLIEGESNSGTSFVVTDVAARVSREGAWPGISLAGSQLKEGTVPVGSVEMFQENHSLERDSPLLQPLAGSPSKKGTVPVGSVEMFQENRSLERAPSNWNSPLFQQAASVVLREQDAHVLFVNGGDNVGDTLLPRLINSGANMARVTVVSLINSHDP